MDRYPLFALVIEDGDEFEAGSEGFEVLPQRGDTHVVGVLELGDGSLGDIESA